MVAVGVDTHKERHYAVALDLCGQLLGELSFAASAVGYAKLHRWAASTSSTAATPWSRSSVRVDANGAPASPTASMR